LIGIHVLRYEQKCCCTRSLQSLPRLLHTHNAPAGDRLAYLFYQTLIPSQIPQGTTRVDITRLQYQKQVSTMAGPPKKRQKREEKQEGEMPQKKYYRQRAHANPFSDHGLI